MHKGRAGVMSHAAMKDFILASHTLFACSARAHLQAGFISCNRATSMKTFDASSAVASHQAMAHTGFSLFSQT